MLLVSLALFPGLINQFGNIQLPRGGNAALFSDYTTQPAESRQQASKNSRAAIDTTQEGDPKPDAAARHRIITNVIAMLKRHHIDAGVAQKAGDALLRFFLFLNHIEGGVHEGGSSQGYSVSNPRSRSLL